MPATSKLAKAYQKLIDDAKANGYAGDADVDSLIAWAKDNTKTDTKQFDSWKKAYKAFSVEVLEEAENAVVLGISYMDDAGEASMDEEDAPEDDAKSAKVDALTNRIKRLEAKIQAKEVSRPEVKVYIPGEREFENRRRKGLTAFNSADDAHAFGQWLIGSTDMSLRIDPKRLGDAQKFISGMKINQTAPVSFGGALVPEQFVADIWDYESAYGVFRANAELVVMNSESATTPKNSGGDDGGFDFFYPEEGGEPTESQLDFASIRNKARILKAVGWMSRELIESSAINIAEYAARKLSTGAQRQEDLAGFLGDGTSTYGRIQGLANIFGASATTNARSQTGGDTSEAHTLAQIHSAMGKLPTRFRTGAKFYCHPTMTSVIFDRLAGAQGGVTWEETANNGFVKKFLGHEIVEVEVMNSNINTGGDVVDFYFGNLAAAAKYGERRAIEITTDPHERWSRDQVGIKGYQRYDINVHEVGTASVAGPIIAFFQT